MFGLSIGGGLRDSVFVGRSLGAGSMKSELQCCPTWRVVTFRGLGFKGFKV